METKRIHTTRNEKQKKIFGGCSEMAAGMIQKERKYTEEGAGSRGKRGFVE